ncbi:MurR/RpiR family transcriptional regulator [Polaromonas sp. SM01]|uniref:MurR/RpiR family transcriptional regulator n=1 Tax=Polaromonas sp. SM01 TaxID=3085630 RepID=UPI0029811E93|nr:MurR/RpiR family transcriptional regulator [Polaromonas sp. SM01]MDW5444920.1 MurR/RpiR family transcriptional regulator [Polaromonas sp. SM01]
MNLNQRISTYGKKLTKSEQRLIEELQAHHPQGLLASATSLAKKVGTSASTVVRLLAKLGYESYAEAQMEARAEVTALLASPATRADAVINDDSSIRSCLANALLHDQHNLSATFASLDVAAFEAAVRLLTQRKVRVHVLGQRHGAAMASHLALHLNLCLPDVRLMASASPLLLEDQLLWIDEHDVLLTPTFRRHSLAITRAAKYFRDKGAKVIVITDGPTAPAAASANHLLLVRTSSASPFDSYTAALSVCNALITAVAQRRKKEMGAALERGEALWERHWNDAAPPARKSSSAR